MEIRKFHTNDKEALLTLMIKFYASPALLHHTEKDVLSKVIDDCISPQPYAEGFVCADEKGIAAYTIVSLGYSTEYGGLSVMIEDLFVAEDRRGSGLGTALLEFVEEEFKKRGAVRLRLEVEKNNLSAQALYERCGFREIGYKQMDKLI